MLTLLIVLTLVFAVLWFLILHALPDGMQRFLCRHQWMFLLIHVPIMWMLSTIMGEGMLAGVGSLAGGLLGQIYLALRGMRKFGLTFFGKKTEQYELLKPQKQGLSRLQRADLVVSKQLVEILGGGSHARPNQK